MLHAARHVSQFLLPDPMPFKLSFRHSDIPNYQTPCSPFNKPPSLRTALSPLSAKGALHACTSLCRSLTEGKGADIHPTHGLLIFPTAQLLKAAFLDEAW